MAQYYGGQQYDSAGGDTKTFNGQTITGAKIQDGHWVGMMGNIPWSAAPGVQPDDAGGASALTPSGGSSSPSPTSPIGAGGVIGATGGGGVSSIAPALSGLKSAGPGANSGAADAGGVFGMPDTTQPVASPAMGPLNLRDGLGTRLYPNETSPLAALRKIY